MRIKVVFTLEISIYDNAVSSYFTDSLSNLPMVGEKVRFSLPGYEHSLPVASVIDKTINYRRDMTVESVCIKIRYPFEEWLDKWKLWLTKNFGFLWFTRMNDIIPSSNEYLYSAIVELGDEGLFQLTFLEYDIDFLKIYKDLFFLDDNEMSLLEHFLHYVKNKRYKQ